jgi:hypothetical protein
MNYEQDANMRAFRYFNENVPGFYTSPADYIKQYNEELIANSKKMLYQRHGWDYLRNPLIPKDLYYKARLYSDIKGFFVDYLDFDSYLDYARKYRIRIFR